MDKGYPTREKLALVCFPLAMILTVVLTACFLVPSAHAATPRVPGYACPLPNVSPFHYRPNGCAIVRPGSVVTLPKGTTEADVWTLNGKHRLRQYRDTYCRCLQWAFAYGSRYSAGWDVTNRDVYNFGKRAVIVYYWLG